MADRPTGPVQPPVIDLTARSANARPEEKARAGDGSTSARMGAGRFPLDASDANWPLLGGAVVAGAVLGTVLTYLVATLFPLPARGPDTPDLGPQLTAQGERLDALSANLSTLETTAIRTQVSLDATIAQLDAGLIAVNQSIAEVQAAIPAPQPPVDLSAIEVELRTLKSQVDAIAAGASGGDASAMAQSLAELESGLASLTTRLNGVDETAGALRTDLETGRAALADHIAAALPNEVGPALKLPLILSGLEGAFANGRPFQMELESLATVLPDFAVPPSLALESAGGLTRPDMLLQRFEAIVPEILAARIADNGDWTQGAIDWAKSLLALRPVGEIEGDGPDAVVSRLEAAMERRDYRTAATLIEQLPQAMQDAAAPVAADIGVHAEADELVADLRRRALSDAAAS